MADTKTAAQLRVELARLEWQEYQDARWQRQLNRVATYQGKLAIITQKRDEAKAQAAQIEAEIKSGFAGVVPKPASGGINITVPAGHLGVKGN